ERFGERALQRLDAVLASGDGRDVRRLDAERPKSPAPEACEQGAVVRADVDAKRSTNGRESIHHVVGKRLLVGDQRTRYATAIRIAARVDDAPFDDVVELREAGIRAVEHAQWIEHFRFAQHLAGEQSVARWLVPQINDEMK